MVVNLIRLVGFQPRLSVIPASLYLMMNDFIHLVIVLLLIALPMSILVVILVGPVDENVNTFSDSLVSILLMFVSGATMEG